MVAAHKLKQSNTNHVSTFWRKTRPFTWSPRHWRLGEIILWTTVANLQPTEISDQDTFSQTYKDLYWGYEWYYFHISLIVKNFKCNSVINVYVHMCSTSQIASIHTWQLCAVWYVGMQKENWMLKMALQILLLTLISLRWVPVNNKSW